MYSLIRAVPVRRLVLEQMPILTASLVIAEVFYKFHSFLLETGAFLATWFVLDALWQGASAAVQRARASGVRP